MKVIQGLGVAGWTQAMTEGIINAVRALEVVVVVNNSSTKGALHFDALVREKEEMARRMTKMEAELAATKKIATENV